MRIILTIESVHLCCTKYYMWYYYAHCFCECFTAHAPQNQHEEDTKHNFYVRSCSPGAKRQLDPGQYGVMVAVDITKGVRKQILNYVTKGSLLAGYLEFYFAKQRGGLDPLSLNVQEKGTPPLPPSKGTLAICLASLFTQQPLRSVSSSSPSSSSTSSSSSSSSSSPSSFDLKFGFFDLHFPSTQRCDDSDRFEHP